MRRVTTLLAALAALASGCSGGTEVESGLTGVDVRLTSHVALDQVVLSGTVGDAPFDSATVPETPGELDPEGESVVVLFPETAAGETLHLRVDGLRDGDVAATGLGEVELEARRIVRLDVELGPPTECGDGEVEDPPEECDDGDVEGGDGCSAACQEEDGWECETVGHRSVCTRTCAAGCGDGQHCVEGLCVCDGTSCSGCCDDDEVCWEGDTNEACGRGGSDCQVCDEANPCSEGTCGTCDRGSCAGGCCHLGVCEVRFPYCGTGGDPCLVCDTDTSDRCSSDSDACLCGRNPPCTGGLLCDTGGVCN